MKEEDKFLFLIMWDLETDKYAFAPKEETISSTFMAMTKNYALLAMIALLAVQSSTSTWDQQYLTQ